MAAPSPVNYNNNWIQAANTQHHHHHVSLTDIQRAILRPVLIKAGITLNFCFLFMERIVHSPGLNFITRQVFWFDDMKVGEGGGWAL